MNETTTHIVSDHVNKIGMLNEKAKNQANQIKQLEEKLEKKSEDFESLKLDCSQQICNLKLFISKENFKMKILILLAVAAPVVLIAGADGAISLAKILATFI